VKKVLLVNNKSLIIATSLFILFAFFITLNQAPRKHLIEREVYADLVESESGLEYLASFDDAKLDIADNGIFYTSKKQVKHYFDVEYLANENFSDYTLNFDVTYMKELDILFMDINLTDLAGEVVERERVFGYMVIDEDGNEDIQFDFYGYYFLGSDFGVKEPVEKTSLNLTIQRALYFENGGGDGGSIVYPLLNISYSIVGLDAAKSNAYKVVKPPILETDGPIKYIMYHAKMVMIENDFKHNSKLTKPTGFINDQHNSKWKNWKFGLSTIYESGCGVIAMYNFLHDTGNNPDFATLIALAQLCNADLAYGIFGANPIPEQYLQLLALEAMIIFDLIVYPIAAAMVPAVAAVIVANYIKEQPWWMQIILGISAPAALLATTAVIESALFAAVVTANVFIANYFSDLHDIADVLKLYKVKKISTSLSLSSYESNLSDYRYSIIAFWNDVGSNGIANFSAGAHTVYVKRHNNTSMFVDYNNSNTSLTPRSQLHAVIDSNRTDASKMFISGMVIKE